jgi:hypothetical protein
MTTKIYLAYHNEDISQFTHPNIIPVKLNQTEFFESELFRMLDSKDVPEADYIGVITPSLFRKVKITLEQLFELKPEPFAKLSLWQEETPCDLLATKYHGPNYLTLMLWLLEELDIPVNIVNRYKGFYSNMWITKRSLFMEYLDLAKKAITVLDKAPPHIQYVLRTNPNWNGKLIGTGILEARFGKTYYPWQPFLMERLICVFAHTKEH